MTVLEQLQKEYKKVLTLTVDKLGKIYTGYFKYPNIEEFEMFWNILNSDTKIPEEAYIYLAETCYLGGDEEFLDFDNHFELFLSYQDDLQDLLEYRMAYIIPLEEVPDQFKQVHQEADDFMYIKLLDGESVYYGVFKKPGFKIYSKAKYFWDKGQFFTGQQELAARTFFTGDKILLDFQNHPNYFCSYKDLINKVLYNYNHKFNNELNYTAISDFDKKDTLLKMKALILANTGIDTTNIDDSEHFATLWNMTEFILKNSPKI